MVVALAVTACGFAGSPPPNTTPPNTTQLASTTSTTTATTVARVEQFAFVRSIDESAISYDPATMLSGEAAAEAARADGVLAEGETLPNDYYISNPDEDEIVARTSTLTGTYILIGFDAMATWSTANCRSRGTGRGAQRSRDPEAFYGIVPGEVPMILTLDGDTVVAARQQYLP